ERWPSRPPWPPRASRHRVWAPRWWTSPGRGRTPTGSPCAGSDSTAGDRELGLGEAGAEGLVELARVEPPVRHVRPLRGARPAARALGGLARVGLVEVELGEQVVQVGEGLDQPEAGAQ